jgi:uncharacterized protein (TIGR02147 family)
MASIFDSSDYRDFLKEHYQSLKSRNPLLSYRWLSAKAGINSSAFFPQVMDGKRNLTKQSLLKVVKALELSGPEAEYFENLVFFNQAKSLDEKNHFFDRLVAIQSQARSLSILPEHYEYFAQWWHPVVREVAVLKPWGDDFEGLAAFLRPAITATQARDSLQLLMRLGFLRKKGKSYLQSEPVLKAVGGPFPDLRLSRFQASMLQLAQQSFDRIPGPERSGAATVFSISEPTFKRFVKRSRQFRAQLQEMARVDENADRVYLLSMHLVPVSQPESNGSSK